MCRLPYTEPAPQAAAGGRLPTPGNSKSKAAPGKPPGNLQGSAGGSSAEVPGALLLCCLRVIGKPSYDAALVT